MGRLCSAAKLVFSWVVLFTVLPLDAVALQVATGSFLGDSMTGRAITGVGFAPDVVMIRSAAGGTTTVMRTATMTTGTKSLVNNQALTPQGVVSLDPDGFTVGSSINTNASGALSHWIAFADVDDGFAVGTYVGDGALSSVDISDTSSSPDFQSDYLILMSEAATTPIQRFEDGPDVSSGLFGFTGPIFSGGDVTDLTATGFTVAGGIRTNDAGVRYHYVAWRERDGTEIGTYDGDGVPGDLTVSLPFSPVLVSVTRATCCVQSRHRSDTQGTDLSSLYTSPPDTTDAIKAFTAGGFVVGDSADVGAAQRHFYVAWERRVFDVPALPVAGLALLGVVLAGVAFASSLKRSRS